MALDKASITSAAMEKLEASGFDINTEHSKQLQMVQAIVDAVVEGIQADAVVAIGAGSSAGNYQVQ